MASYTLHAVDGKLALEVDDETWLLVDNRACYRILIGKIRTLKDCSGVNFMDADLRHDMLNVGVKCATICHLMSEENGEGPDCLYIELEEIGVAKMAMDYCVLFYKGFTKVNYKPQPQ